ncbi:hypothetical protein EDD18DRAFT_1362372 [Armillaria luteobubalina]|uniref:Uncharacterized protein n=1 Tax=Armillaria luteobubalina TaxID=153913 RepID=A0AA39UHJ0_9AGAR|nr:hypothetical protein EDD18DRAFT_1362372 [Armillaria luteobubalina]
MSSHAGDSTSELNASSQSEPIHAIDTVEPTPLYSNLYTPLEDIRMGGFMHSELATVFEEGVEEAVE